MTSHVDETPSPPLIGRRAVARGAAWSVPVVALAVAAPASAAASHGGGCTITTGSLVWKSQKLAHQQANLFAQALQTSVAAVTLTVTATGDTGAANNGVPSTGPIGGATSLLLLHSVNGKSNTTQTITLKFSAKVQNLQLTILDVDSSQTVSRGSKTNHWQDKISILPAPSSQTRGSGVQGSGTSVAPWRAVSADNVVSDTQTTGNIRLSWAGALDTITIVYSQDGSQDGSPKVGIGDLSFQTVC
jgi:hypothetical protein